MPFGLQLVLQLTQGQIKPDANACDITVGLSGIDFRRAFADQHRNFCFVMTGPNSVALNGEYPAIAMPWRLRNRIGEHQVQDYSVLWHARHNFGQHKQLCQPAALLQALTKACLYINSRTLSRAGQDFRCRGGKGFQEIVVAWMPASSLQGRIYGVLAVENLSPSVPNHLPSIKDFAWIHHIIRIKHL